MGIHTEKTGKNREKLEKCGMSDTIDHQVENLKSVEPQNYLFENPSAEPDPRLLELLPKKSTLEYIVDLGLHFVALFQFVCLFALFWLKDPKETKEEEKKKNE